MIRTTPARLGGLLAAATALALGLAPASASTPAATGCVPSWHVLPVPDAAGSSVFAAAVSAVAPGRARIATTTADGTGTVLQASGGLTFAPAQPRVPIAATGDPAGSANDSTGSVSSFDSPSDGWVLGSIPYDAAEGESYVVDHWSRGRWTFEPLGAAQNPLLRPSLGINAMDARTPTDAWIVGGYRLAGNPFVAAGAVIQHWDGAVWQAIPNPLDSTEGAQLFDVEARSATDVWAVGSYRTSATALAGVLLHYDGTKWRRMSLPAGDGQWFLQSVSAPAADDIWVVGTQTLPDSDALATGLVEHWDGMSWQLVNGLPTRNVELTSVYASGPDDVWATELASATQYSGRPQHFLHYDGRAWRQVTVPDPPEYGITPTYQSIDGTGPGDVWATGSAYNDPYLTATLVVSHLTC